MKIHQEFIGGNIEVEKIEDNHVYLKNQLRDITGTWFYWAFCIEGAEGKTLTFHFEEHRLGYLGPAISHDLKTFKWLNSLDDDNSFTYTFGENEGKVYFAHDILYHPERFYKFCDERNIEVKEFCKSNKGSSVPFITFGNGDKTILLTARHHACESTGNYVLEGVLNNLLKDIPMDYKFICVPFMDFDGVINGDQGKQRIPHDHNRDYTKDATPIYAETKRIREIVDNGGVEFGFDFHSPWHKGSDHDTALIVHSNERSKALFDEFGKLLEEHITPDSFKYYTKNDLYVGRSWNAGGSHTFSSYVIENPDGKLAFTLETPYFGTKDKQNVFTEESGIALGNSFAEAMKKYIEKSV